MSRPRLPLLLLLPLTACPAGDDSSDSSTGSAASTGDASTTASATDDPTTLTPTTGDPPETSGTTTDDPNTTAPTTDLTSGTTTDDPSTGDPVGPPTVILPRAGLDVSELALLVNDQDPQAMAVAAYYAEKRKLPPGNIITLSFPVSDTLSVADFGNLKAQIDAALSPQIQAFAIAWTNPHKVECQSLVSALALGADKKFCSTQGNPCGPSAPSGFYNSASLAPFTDHALRPAMHLAGVTADDVFKLIDRGVASDSTYPTGTGYFVRTTDTARSVRWPDQQGTQAMWDYDGGLDLQYLDNSAGMSLDYIENKTDVLFYLTGLADVPQLKTNTYLPGAIADHLTSYGGQIPQSGQMSIVRWLEAGATGSYGTAFEPCNYPDKFPVASVLLPHYFRGETLIEAYWKSVAWPGEGVFIGEPLARPWGGAIVAWEDPKLTIATYQLVPGAKYMLESGDSADGPWSLVTGDLSIAMHMRAEITVQNATAPFYRISPQP